MLDPHVIVVTPARGRDFLLGSNRQDTQLSRQDAETKLANAVYLRVTGATAKVMGMKAFATAYGADAALLLLDAETRAKQSLAAPQADARAAMLPLGDVWGNEED